MHIVKLVVPCQIDIKVRTPLAQLVRLDCSHLLRIVDEVNSFDGILDPWECRQRLYVSNVYHRTFDSHAKRHP